MPVYVAFLRAINVTGRFVRMETLAEAFRREGHADARTYINSGNVVFSSRSRDGARLGARLEAALPAHLGFVSEVFVRSENEVRAIAGHAQGLLTQAVEVNVAFLPSPLTPEQHAALETLHTGFDRFEAVGREVFWLCGVRQSESRFSNAVLERRLRVRSTLRRARMLQGLVQALP